MSWEDDSLEKLARFEAEALRKTGRTITYTVVARGKSPFTVEANCLKERVAEMRKHGVDPDSDNWAAGYITASRKVNVFGPDKGLKHGLTTTLRRS